MSFFSLPITLVSFIFIIFAVKMDIFAKKMRLRLWIILLCCPLCCTAQTERRDSIRARVHRRMEWLNNLLIEKKKLVNYDTAYIQRPKQNLTLKLRTNVSGAAVHVNSDTEELKGKTNLSTDHKATISVGANYLGITAGIALNPAALSGKNNDYELNLNAYGNRFGFDVVYQSSQTLSGDILFNGKQFFLGKGVMNMRTLNINGYYALSGSRFSYPAAFTQSYIQRRSAGSWLLGFSFLGGSFKTTDQKTEDMPTYRIYLGHFGIGGGYGYNLVLKHGWLIHVSALPTLLIANNNNVKSNGVRRDMKTKFPEVILAERAAVVHNFGEKYFFGATLVMNNSILDNADMDIRHRKWRTRIFFGYRL